MKIQADISLADYSTMRLGGLAKNLVEVENEAQLTEAVEFAKNNKLPIHVIGEGSNTIFSDSAFSGLAIVNKITGLEVSEANGELSLRIGAGENWDAVVAKTVEAGFGDIAALSKVPGSAGAAPVQNIGAYGQQISDSIISVRALDLQSGEYVEILRTSCNFSYRHSRFNLEDKGRFIITYIKLQLSRKNVSPPFYADVEHYFAVHDIAIDSVTPQNLRDAVTEIRANKLPDPTQVANTGSFFGNPVVTEEQFASLITEHPELRSHTTDDGKLKLYAGQLIEIAGLKNYHDKETGMATWKNQSLVLVNEHAKKTSDLLQFRQKVIANVQATSGITLVQEPEFVGDDTIA
jgi:UDP-N-acetylmuramate dehydrogenase